MEELELIYEGSFEKVYQCNCGDGQDRYDKDCDKCEGTGKVVVSAPED